MYLYLYNKLTGEFEGSIEVPEEMMYIPIETHIGAFVSYYPEDEKVNINGIYVENLPKPTRYYRVIDGEIVKKPDSEINLPTPEPQPTQEQQEIANLKLQVEELQQVIDIVLNNTFE